jgi:hypothetical protein
MDNNIFDIVSQIRVMQFIMIALMVCISVLLITFWVIINIEITDLKKSIRKLYHKIMGNIANLEFRVKQIELFIEQNYSNETKNIVPKLHKTNKE